MPTVSEPVAVSSHTIYSGEMVKIKVTVKLRAICAYFSVNRYMDGKTTLAYTPKLLYVSYLGCWALSQGIIST